MSRLAPVSSAAMQPAAPQPARQFNASPIAVEAAARGDGAACGKRLSSGADASFSKLQRRAFDDEGTTERGEGMTEQQRRHHLPPLDADGFVMC